MRIISKKEWADIPKSYKSIGIDGQRRILRLTKRGTMSVPVKVT